MGVPCPKDPPGTRQRAKLNRALEVEAHEQREKAKVRKRDVKCRRPNCPNCREYRGRLTLHVAHLTPKGMGGDKTGRVTTAAQMLRLDAISHEEQEHGALEVVVRDPARGTDGPCEFWRVKGEARWFEGVS